MRNKNNWIRICFLLFFAAMLFLFATSKSKFYDSFKSTKDFTEASEHVIENGISQYTYSFQAVGNKTRYIMVNFAKEEEIDHLRMEIRDADGVVLASKDFTDEKTNALRWSIEQKIDYDKQHQIILQFPEGKDPAIASVKLKYHNFNTIEYFGGMALAGCMILLILWDWFRKKEYKTEEPKKIHIGHMAELLYHGLASFLMLEIVFENKILYQMDHHFIGYNWMFAVGIYVILFLFFHSFKTSVIAGNVFFMVWAIANQFVFLFKGQPIQPIDLLNIKTAGAVASEYTYDLTWQMMAAILYVGTVIYITVRRKEVKICLFKEKKNWKRILFPAAGTLLFAAGLLFITKTDAITDLNIYVHYWRNQTTYNRYGVPMGFLGTAKKMQVKEPESYSKETMEEMMEPYIEEAKKQKVSETNPHIIAIMNESFADLSYIKPDLETNVPYLSFYNSLKENTVKGHLLVSPFGGWTPNSEYEFLFGHSMEMLGSSIPYSQYLNRVHDTLASNLAKNGYDTIAYHPHKAENWRRNVVYPNIGFDSFLSEKELPEKETVRSWASDEWNYEQLYQMMEENEEGERKFIFNVTMQNHGGYDYDEADFVNDVQILGADFPDANQYLSLIKKSDEALQGLIEYFTDYDEPVVIVFFGDHYPNIKDGLYDWLYGKSQRELTQEEKQKKYTVPFFIWANYDIPEEENVMLSTNYLSTKVMEVAGMAKTPYQMYLTELMENIPQINVNGYVGADGKHYTLDEESPYKVLIDQYNMIQYNELFDKKNKIESFFQIP